MTTFFVLLIALASLAAGWSYAGHVLGRAKPLVQKYPAARDETNPLGYDR